MHKSPRTQATTQGSGSRGHHVELYSVLTWYALGVSLIRGLIVVRGSNDAEYRRGEVIGRPQKRWPARVRVGYCRWRLHEVGFQMGRFCFEHTNWVRLNYLQLLKSLHRAWHALPSIKRCSSLNTISCFPSNSEAYSSEHWKAYRFVPLREKNSGMRIKRRGLWAPPLRSCVIAPSQRAGAGGCSLSQTSWIWTLAPLLVEHSGSHRRRVSLIPSSVKGRGNPRRCCED